MRLNATIRCADRPRPWRLAAVLALACGIAAASHVNGAWRGAEARSEPDTEALELVGQVGGAAWSGAMDGDSVLIGVGPRLVQARLPDPDVPDSLFEEVGRSAVLPHLVTSVAVADGIAYATMYDWGVALVRSESPPPAPGDLPVLSTMQMHGNLGSIAVRGSKAYIAAEHDGVRVVDASDPGAPSEVPFGDEPDAGVTIGDARDVTVVGDLLLVACGGTFDRPAPGLRVFDLAAPGPAPEIADFLTPGEAELVVASGHWAYVVHAGPDDTDRQALWVVDLSEPESPRVAAELLLTDLVWDLALDGDLLYIAADEHGVITYDVADPETPRLLGFVGAGLAHGVRAAGDKLVVFTGGGPVRSFDMRTPREPSQMQAYHTVGHTADLAGAGSELLVAEWSHWPGGALRVLDALDSDQPELSHSEYQEQWQEAVAGVPGAAYIGGYDDVLRVFDLPEDGRPELVSALGSQGSIVDLVAEGGLVYAALAIGRGGALWIVDTSQPSEPVEVSRLLTGDAAYGLCIAGDLAFVAAEGAGLLAVDITDPSEPRTIGSLDGFGLARGVAVHSGHAFVATYDSGLAVIDVTRPEAPRLVAQLPHQRGMGSAHDIVTDGSAAYMAATETGVAVVDVRRPSQPVLVATYDTPGVVWSVLLAGPHLYAADEAGGVLAYQRLPLGPIPTAGPTRTATATPSATAVPPPTAPSTPGGPGRVLCVPWASKGR